MSSFVGHTLAAATIYVNDKRGPHSRADLAWALWLVVAAAAPDIDYAVRALRVGAAEVRLTHSLLGASAVPVLTILLGLFIGWRGPVLTKRSLQVTAAGLSHLVLDLLVGVHPMPLLWPLSQVTVVLPFGILPSSPYLSLTNVYLYRNLLIEVGILAPLCLGLYLLRSTQPRALFWYVSLAGLGLISLFFMTWGLNLTR